MHQVDESEIENKQTYLSNIKVTVVHQLLQNYL